MTIRRSTRPFRSRTTTAIAAALAMLALVGCAGDPGDDGGVQMQEGSRFSGDGDQETAAFEAGENWELSWQAEAEAFAIELVGEDGESRGTIVEAEEPGEGATFISEGGEFRLRVTADGEWEIEISTPE